MKVRISKNPDVMRLELMKGGAVRMQDGGDPAEQMFNFNPMAAQAMRQERMRREAEEAKRYKSVMGTTPQDLLRRVEPPPAEMSALPLSKTPTTLDRLARSSLEALGMPKPRAQSVASNVKSAIEMLVPDPERIYREMSEAAEERDPLKFGLANLEASLGYMPFAKPVVGAAKAIGATALDAGKVAGREMLRPIDQAMFGEGPLAGAFSLAAPLQAVPKMQAPVSPLGFYNPVEQAALNVQRKQGPGQAFLKELQRGENVSKDFLQSSGLAERLAAMPNVTREEVQRMAKGSVPEVEEIVRGEQFSKAIEQEQKAAGQLVEMIDNNLDGTIRLQNLVGPVYSDEALYYLQDGTAKPEQFPEHLQELARQYVQLHQKAKTTKNLPAIYNREDLILPGGENYREVLLTLPQKEISPEQRQSIIAKRQEIFDQYNPKIEAIHQQMLRATDRDLYNKLFDDYERLSNERDIKAKEFAGEVPDKLEPVKYQSSHWRDTPNVLSHIRMNDRTDAEGKKVLFIEELQSDWAQEGRKSGFNLSPTKIVNSDGTVTVNYGNGQIRTFQNESAADDSIRTATMPISGSMVPPAPFVQNTKDWVDLSLKNILKRAVDEGYDRVAFINGKQSADRYNLLNYVSTIDWNPPSNRLQQKGANSFVKIYLHDGNPIELPLTREGKVLKNTGTQFDGKSLGDIVGEKVAQKIMASPYGTLAGEGLSVGGMGMKKFYDEIVPERVRKVLGKDTTLRQIQFEDPAAKLREELASATPGSSHYLYLTDKIGQLEREAERYGAVGNQLGFDITPEIRDKFSKPIPYKKGGSVRISNNPDTMRLELLRKKHA